MMAGPQLVRLLTAVEARVLGALVEKDVTTPDYYPLSLNALVHACNQKNNRDPVMTLDDAAVLHALDRLQEAGLAGPAAGADARVPKYEHRLQEVFNFTRAETAVFCTLLLRGPQTPGELRGRTERMHRFEHLDEVQAVLQKLMQREPPLASVLPRQPGTKESRYRQLLSEDAQGPSSPQEAVEALQPHGRLTDDTGRLALLEQQVDALRKEVEALSAALAELRRHSG